MISNKAIVHSNPQLEIYNNDVKCSHGSTTGEVDSDVLFYMQSRGLDKQECKKLILHGFATEIIDRLDNINIKNIVQKKSNRMVIKCQLIPKSMKFLIFFQLLTILWINTFK